MDHSAMSTLLSCPKKYEYLYVHRKAEETQSAALKGGTFWHKIIEEHGKRGFCDVDALAAKLGWVDPPDDYRTLAKYRLGYQRWRVGNGSQYRFLDTEHGFYVNVAGTNEPMEGRIDNRIEWDSNQGYGVEEWIGDLKTTGRLESNWVQTYRLSDQFQMYTTYGRVMWPKVVGVLVDVFHCTKGNKSGKSEGEVEGVRFYQLPIRFDERHVEETRRTFVAAVELKELYAKNKYYPPNRAACKMYGRTCGFADVCDTHDPQTRADLLASYPENTFDPHADE